MFLLNYEQVCKECAITEPMKNRSEEELRHPKELADQKPT